MDLKFVKYEKRNHIAYITFNRPERLNALHPPCHIEMDNVWDDFVADKAMWVAIVTGAGDKAFSAGNDLRWTAENREQVTEGLRGKGGFAGITARYDIYKPIIAAVNGPCVAGGMEMLGGVDIRVASEHATFGVLEPARGLFAGGGTTVRLPRQIPFAHAMEFLLCADVVDAPRAMEMGLLNAVVSEDALLDTAFAYAARITKNAPLAVQATKRSVLEGLKVDMREAYRNESQIAKEVFATEDAKEGPRAFAEKRVPKWSGS